MQRFKHEIRHREWAFCKGGRIGSWVVLFSLVLAVNASARTLNVPNDYLTIQEAINACDEGDTIVVGAGAYSLTSDGIVISRRSLTLKSAHGPEKTIIKGTGTSSVISIAEDSRAVIDGFTVTRVEYVELEPVKGGGIYCAPSSSPIIMNSIITGNRAVFGGGIYCAPWSSPTIRNNVISENQAMQFGGGIFSNMASPNIVNNRIVANKASSIGGGIFCNRDTPRVTNNIFFRNKAKSGGGISCDRSFCTIINDTITENAATYGGGIFFEGGAVKILNSILWENGDDLYSARFSGGSRPDHCNIGDGDFRGVNGNISADPLFAEPQTGDFRLQPDSPCLNTGNPDPTYNDPDGSRNDMGAYGGPKANPGS